MWEVSLLETKRKREEFAAGRQTPKWMGWHALLSLLMEPSSASPDKAIWHVKSSVYGHIISGNKAEERTCYTPHLVQTASTHSVHAGSTSTKQLLTTALIPSLFLLWSRLRWGLHHAKTSFILKVYHPPPSSVQHSLTALGDAGPLISTGAQPKAASPLPYSQKDR